MDLKNSRRDFIKYSLTAIGGLVATKIFGVKLASAQGTPTNALDVNDPMAKTLGYVENASKVDLVKFPRKAGPDGAKQKCANCILLTQTGLKVAGKDGVYGLCGLFRNGLVASEGWCNSYAAKPGA